MYTRNLKLLKEHYLQHFDVCPELCQLYLDNIKEYEKTTKKTIQRKVMVKDMIIC